MPEIQVVTRRFREHRDAHLIQRYIETGGYQALKRALESHSPEEVTQMVDDAGLRGRGGGGFPTGKKWSLMPQNVFPRYVVANDDEGEPCTFKDRELTERDPHSILEGAILAAYAVRAEAVYIYVRGEFGLAWDRLKQARLEAVDYGFIGENILDSGFGCQVILQRGAGAYICGEETALLNSLEGVRGEPRLKPPYFPAVQGLFGQPTALNNVETLATLPHILLRGADWFKSMGTRESPGTRIFSVSGCVTQPGNYEFELGSPLPELIQAAGGIRRNNSFTAVICGFSAPIVTDPNITLDYESFADAGSMLGSGSILVLDNKVCALEVAQNIARFFNHESCGKCTPCREGTWWQVKLLDRLVNGTASSHDVDLLINLCDRMSVQTMPYLPKGTCFCPLGDGAAWSVRALVQAFPDDFFAHATGKTCPAQADSS